MPIGAQMQSTSYSNLLVTDRLTIGTLSIRVHKMQVQLLEKNVFTLGRDARTRHTALFETSPHETWKVPRGETIIGVTIVPRNEATLNILKALPTSLQSTEQVTTPCGEVAFALYKTADASTLTSCNPAGTFVYPNTSNFNSETTFVTGTPYTPADNAFTSFWSNFSHTNNSASGNIATGGTWGSIAYRTVVSNSGSTQVGAPKVWADASRVLFANSTMAGIYLPYMDGQVSDGTLGIGMAFISQCGYSATTGATKWPAMYMDVYVHTQSV